MADEKFRYSDGFHTRFATALADHPKVPNKRGAQTWVVQQFADRHNVKVSRPSVHRWLSGTMMPRRDNVAILAEILGVDPQWLLFGTSPMASNEGSLDPEKYADVALLAAAFEHAGIAVADLGPGDHQDRVDGIDFHIVYRRQRHAVTVARREESQGQLGLTAAGRPGETAGPRIILAAVKEADSAFGNYDVYDMTQAPWEDRGDHATVSVLAKSPGAEIVTHGGVQVRDIERHLSSIK